MSAASQIMPHRFTLKIVLALIFGAIIGLAVRILPLPDVVMMGLVDGIFHTGGIIFIDLLKMLVVPVVFVSLVCGVSSLQNVQKLGRIGLKTFGLYLLTTLLALIAGLSFAALFNIGSGASLVTSTTFTPLAAHSFKDVLLGMIPSNPIQAMATGNLLQLIVFALMFGMALMMAGEQGQVIRKLFISIDAILHKLVFIVMVIAPYGIFCLLASLFAKQGLGILDDLFQYFMVVIFVLLFQLAIVYSFFLWVIGKINPRQFFKKMYTTMLFAFSISSSNAAIPVVLETAEKKLGVDNSVASFVIPLGATINMDGTAIMQSVATVFIAHAYQIDIGLSGYVTVVVMAMLASIGTAGVPSVGLITLTMVLQQVGLPTEGIALIIGIDRLLDMLRTSVNISGDTMVACLVAKSEGLLDEKILNSPG
tara:strand:- start:190 stop:1455 length:1266 start_codon:yes stop_codon:yes gene_type:complete